VLDANVFIEAARRYYAFDLAPGFWQSLIDCAAAEQIRSIDKVADELAKGKDELADWAENNFADAFASTDSNDVTQSYAEIITWVTGQVQFSGAAKADFAQGADGWLVAFARAKGYTVVTHEELAPDVRRKVPIPNVCNAFGVPYINTFQMLRALGVRFN
jgi:hypothetical protein